jgi:FkbM family methyltransferase
MKKTIYFFQVLLSYYLRFGFSGITLLVKRALLKGKVIEIKIPKIKYSFFLRNGTSDISVFNQIFYHGEYENDYRATPKTIIDCGANIGLSAIFFTNKFPNAKIIAVEPEKSNYKMLIRNTKDYSNIKCLNYGIWSKSCNLLIENKHAANWGFTTKEVNYENENVIKSLSLIDIFSNNNINEVDILKIDIESAEKEVFEVISKDFLKKVKIIIIELHDRMKMNCSKTFFNAIADFDYVLEFKGEYVVCYLNN